MRSACWIPCVQEISAFAWLAVKDLPATRDQDSQVGLPVPLRAVSAPPAAVRNKQHSWPVEII